MYSFIDTDSSVLFVLCKKTNCAINTPQYNVHTIEYPNYLSAWYKFKTPGTCGIAPSAVSCFVRGIYYLAATTIFRAVPVLD